MFVFYIQNSSSSDTSGSDWECSGTKQNSAHKPHFSVTSCDTGLKLKIAAIPRKVKPKKASKPSVKKKGETSEGTSKTTKNARKKTTPTKKKQLSDSSSSTGCSKCSSESSSDDDIPLKAVSKTLPTKCSPQKTAETLKNNVKSGSEEDRRSSEDKDTASKTSNKDKPSAKTKVVQKTKSDESSEVKRTRGRPRTKVSGNSLVVLLHSTFISKIHCY